LRRIGYNYYLITAFNRVLQPVHFNYPLTVAQHIRFTDSGQGMQLRSDSGLHPGKRQRNLR